MDNATLSLLRHPIFWTFLVAGILCLAGSALVSYPKPRRRRYRDEHEQGGIGA